MARTGVNQLFDGTATEGSFLIATPTHWRYISEWLVAADMSTIVSPSTSEACLLSSIAVLSVIYSATVFLLQSSYTD